MFGRISSGDRSSIQELEEQASRRNVYVPYENFHLHSEIEEVNFERINFGSPSKIMLEATVFASNNIQISVLLIFDIR